MKPLHIKVFVALLLFSAHFQSFADNKETHISGGLSVISFRPKYVKAGDTVQITGIGFSGITSVRFGGILADSFVITSPSTIRAYIGVVPSGYISVTAGGVTDSISGFFYDTAQVIQSVSPTQGYLGDTIYFHGQSLLGVTEVKFGGVNAPFTVISDTLLWASVAANSQVIELYKKTDYHNYNYKTEFDGFTFKDSTTPVILSFTPDTAHINQSVTIRGRHFRTTTSMQFGTTQKSPFTVVSDSVITANPMLFSSSGNISVTTNYGTAVLGGFYFLDYSPLVFSSFSPDTAYTGSTVLIRGSGMLYVNGVYFGGTPATSFTKLSDSLISAVVGDGSSGNIVLTTNWNGTDSMHGFKYYTPAPAPIVLSFTPDNGTKGTPIRIIGHNFTTTTEVFYGGCRAESFKIISDSVIDGVAGSGCSGPVYVVNGAGTGSLAGFTYHYPPPPSPDTGYAIARFNASVENSHAVIHWEIGNESAIGKFIVQRAPDSVSFVTMDSVAPLNNRQTNEYSATDTNMLTGLNNYRLAVVDTLGNIEYSMIVTVINATNIPIVDTPAIDSPAVDSPRIDSPRLDSSAVNTNTIKLYPNPTTGNITVNHPASPNQSSIIIMDMTGKTVRTINVSPNSIETKIVLNSSFHGLYRVVWTDGKRTTSRNLLIQSH